MTRELVLTQNVTLDGVVDMTTGWADPANDEVDPAHVALNAEHMAAEGALLLGRRTFEDFRGFWPTRAADDPTGVSAHLDAEAKIVVSSTLTDPDWQNTTVLTGDPLAEVAALKAGDGGPIGCTGSITLAHALLRAGLVDEVRMFTHPVVVGTGRRFFPDGQVAGAWRRVAFQAFRTGVTFTAHRAVQG
jgi:dihydrofolate reductase